ncbi:MAG TPA: hypothetical protein VD758_11140 [Gemmatimonadaceae bacterium]|nr:hypothetical protein [Gemmatimonadaceae bacterium]
MSEALSSRDGTDRKPAPLGSREMPLDGGATSARARDGRRRTRGVRIIACVVRAAATD